MWLFGDVGDGLEACVGYLRYFGNLGKMRFKILIYVWHQTVSVAWFPHWLNIDAAARVLGRDNRSYRWGNIATDKNLCVDASLAIKD